MSSRGTTRTDGYFNVGESTIYLAVLTSTPLIARIASGIGVALADLSTGYAVFAPGILVIKFIEGYLGPSKWFGYTFTPPYVYVATAI